MAVLEVGGRHNGQHGEGDLLGHQSVTAWLLRQICIREDEEDVTQGRRYAEERSQVMGEVDYSIVKNCLDCAGTNYFDLRMHQH
jgi:hypothetical protein